MGTYKISIKIEIAESDDEKCSELRTEPNGTFTMAISDTDAISIDKSEKALLQTSYPAIREALKQHLTEISKKKLLKDQDPERSS
jgi:hypothetical protein